MGWIAKELAQPGDQIQGMIISHTGDEQLRYGLMVTRNIELMLYEVDFHLKKPSFEQ